MASSSGGWIGVDLDGTLAHDTGRYDSYFIGAPIPAMVERVQIWIADGQTVKIVTARVAHDPDGAARRAIQAWCEEYVGIGMEVTCAKDFGMIELWDDRCIQVITNTGQPVGVTGAFRWLFFMNGGRRVAAANANLAAAGTVAPAGPP